MLLLLSWYLEERSPVVYWGVLDGGAELLGSGFISKQAVGTDVKRRFLSGQCCNKRRRLKKDAAPAAERRP